MQAQCTRVMFPRCFPEQIDSEIKCCLPPMMISTDVIETECRVFRTLKETYQLEYGLPFGGDAASLNTSNVTGSFYQVHTSSVHSSGTVERSRDDRSNVAPGLRSRWARGRAGLRQCVAVTWRGILHKELAGSLCFYISTADLPRYAKVCNQKAKDT
jgi:hypothetical protein